MLEVLNKFICSSIIYITEYLIINKLLKNKIKFPNKKQLLLIIGLILFQTIISKSIYDSTKVFISFIVTTIITKYVFEINYEKAFVACGLSTLVIFTADALCSIVLVNFFTLEEIKSNIGIYLITNISVSLISLALLKIKKVCKKLQKYLEFNQSKQNIINNVFIILIIICFILLGYKATQKFGYNFNTLFNIIMMIVFSTMLYILIINKIKYHQLVEEYDTLFEYIQNFEEWIEKEQINKHEYKNQLAVIRSITRDKKVINYINKILGDTANIKGDITSDLRKLPKGGIKGLLYYKVIIAQKKKVNISADVNLSDNNLLTMLTAKQRKILYNLMGIYLDNAIEAAELTKKKNILIEIYEQMENVKIVVSNTFNKNESISNCDEKGYTTKGKGHGNGLYYANNLLEKNKWIESSKDIIDDYYIQYLLIKKQNKK